MAQAIDTSRIHCPVGHPGDLDVFYDGLRFGGPLIFGESKCDRGHLTIGQQLSLENIVKNLSVPAIAMYMTHTTYDTAEDIPLEESKVEQAFANFPLFQGAVPNRWYDFSDKDIRVGKVFDWLFKK